MNGSASTSTPPEVTRSPLARLLRDLDPRNAEPLGRWDVWTLHSAAGSRLVYVGRLRKTPREPGGTGHAAM